MMLKNSLLFTLSFLILGFSSCYEDLIVENKVTESFDPEVAYLNEIRGAVIDTFGTPIANVRVRIDDIETATDTEGQFVLYNVPVAQYGSYIEMTKNGYYDTGVRVYPNDGLKLAASIVMVEKAEGFSFDSGEGAKITTNSGLQLDIAPNSFNKNGSPYSGEIYIHVFWVDPTHTDDYKQKPQVYESLPIQGEPPYDKPSFLSMAYISVTDDTGAPLNVVPDSPVIIYFPTTMLENASYTTDIELLSLSEEIGLWVKEGVAEQNGTTFKAELNHFSWWTIAYTQTGASLCIDFNASTGSPGSDQLFTVNKTDGTIVSVGSVSYEADVCIPVPREEELEISIYSSCFQLIGTYSYTGTSDEVGEVVINVDPHPSAIIIEGRLLDCVGQEYPYPVEIIYSTDRSQDDLGTFSTTFQIDLDPCFSHDVLYVIARDTARDLTGSVEVYTNISTDVAQSIDIILCDLTGSFLLDDMAFDNVVGRNNKEETLIIVTTDDERSILIGIDGFSEGTFAGRLFDLMGNVCEGDVTISKYGDIGDTIEGTYDMPTNDLGCPGYTGSFQAIREK